MRSIKEGVMLTVVITVIMAVAFVYATVSAAACCDDVAGKQIFEKSCAACHGKDGKGFMPKMPDFSKSDRMDKADNDLIASISGGVKGTIMPAWKGKLSDADIKNVLSYIRSLGPQKVSADTVQGAKDKKAEESPCGDKNKDGETKSPPPKK